MDSANRRPTPRANRKRGRTAGDASSSVVASSPMPSSPPAFNIAHGGDDDDELDDPEAEIQDDIDELDEMAEDDVDLFREGFERDYREKDDNDEYEGIDIDDEGEYGDLDIAERRRLEAQLNRRDRQVARRRQMPNAFLPDEDDEGHVDLPAQPRRRRQQRTHPG